MSDLKVNARKFIEQYFKIVDKEGNLVTLSFNEAQDDIYNTIKERKRQGKPSWILVLKARQLGMSTFTEALGTEQVITRDNTNMIIMTQEEKASNNLYRMAHRYYENLPDWFKGMVQIVKDNQALMQFSNDSMVQVMVASPNSKGTGRGQTINFAHLSEFDWWSGDALGILGGILSACTKDAIVIIETTANGCGNFKKLWDEAMKNQLKGDVDGWIPKFYAWYQDKNYVAEYSGFELTKEEEDLKEKFNLSNEQIAWRRRTIQNVFSGDVNMFHQEFPSTPEEAFISSGNCIFDLNKINERKYEIRQNQKIVDKGYYLYELGYDSEENKRMITEYKWVSDWRNGYIIRYKEIDKRMPYVIAIDPAGDGSDYSSMQVLNNRSCEQECVLHMQHLNSFEIACMAYCLGSDYNFALIGAETNFAPEVMAYLKELDYPTLYLTTKENTSLVGGVEKKYGFRTTTVTRPYVISFLIDYVNNNIEKINDYDTLIEAENFVRVYKTIAGKTTQKEQANVGCHDDLLMSLGIALYMRDSGQQTFDLFEEEVTPKKRLEFDEMLGICGDEDSEEDMTYDYE